MTQIMGQKISGSERPSDISILPEIDRYRSFIFPNNIRKYRKARQIDSLLQLSERIPTTTYIRLSKIERGEIFARPNEMHNIAEALGVEVEQLLIDIDDPAFSIAEWAEDYQNAGGLDEEADTLAVLLAAAMRARRARDEALTIAVLERDYSIAPVILSRIENAFKALDRWSASIQQSLFRLFAVEDLDGLIAYLKEAHARGEWDAILPHIANPAERIAKTRNKLQNLRADLAEPKNPLRRRRDSRPTAENAAPVAAKAASIAAQPTPTRRMLPIYGTPLLQEGLIARTDTGEQIEAPAHAGPHSYALRICKPTLGPGMPGRAIVIVDPDRFPSAGSLAILQEKDGLRLLAVTSDRQGQMIGFSTHPDVEVALDSIDPKDMATILAAHFE